MVKELALTEAQVEVILELTELVLDQCKARNIALCILERLHRMDLCKQSLGGGGNAEYQVGRLEVVIHELAPVHNIEDYY